MEPKTLEENHKTFQYVGALLPKLAKEQLDLIKNYTEVFIDEDDE